MCKTTSLRPTARRVRALRPAAPLLLLVVVMSLGAIPARGSSAAGYDGTRSDTLWIFDADFSNETGDNAGWTTADLSGTLGVENYWHRDTLRPCPRPVGDPGDWSWWCGTYDQCWVQPRGYGNDWTCCLERELPLSEWSEAGDQVLLEWDQRYAMEMWYDYGYVDISSDGGDSWATIATFNNKGFLHPGTGADWDSPTFGHPQEDVSSYAGTDIRLRFRFESDCCYSSEDQEDNPHHSVKDGAWQLDNIEVKVGGTTAWLDGCETGENGWEHTDVPASAQVGLAFWRGQFGVDFVTGRPVLPHEPPAGTWMQAAVGPDLSSLVDDQVSWLYSPPVDIDGAPGLVCEWTGWLDLPRESNDYGGQFVGSGDVFECITFGDLEPDLLDIGPGWTTEHLNWSPYVGNKWLKAAWAVWGGIPDPGRDHLAGLFLNRVRVGVPLETGAPAASSSRGLALGHPL